MKILTIFEGLKQLENFNWSWGWGMKRAKKKKPLKINMATQILANLSTFM
jgi:hypothetical protein